MALSITECRKNRGNAKGCITRAGNQVGYFIKADITALDPTALTRMTESVERADESFQVHHDMLTMSMIPSKQTTTSMGVTNTTLRWLMSA